MKSIIQFMALMFCLFVGISMLLVADVCAAEDPNYYYYSGTGDDLVSIMYMEVDLGNYTTAYLNFSTKFENKPGDSAHAVIAKNLDDLILSWEYLNGSEPNWIRKSYDFSRFSLINGTCYVGFYYKTDDSGISKGFWVDNIEITVDGETIFEDDGTNETWIFKGFSREPVPPVIDQPADMQIEKEATDNITWIVTETDPNMYWVLRDSTEDVVSPRSYKNKEELNVPINTSSLEIKKYTYKIFANDTSGNNASDLVNITVKAQEAPTIKITSPVNGYSTTSDSVTISGNVNGTYSTPTVIVNKIPAKVTLKDDYAGTFSVSVSLDVNDNPINAINATVTDAAGLTAYDSITVTRNKVSSGGGGGGGGGTSGEDFGNILVSEIEREYVNKDSKVSYSFDQEGNIIRYINFTGKTSSGRIAAKIDTLKNTSTLVDHAPPGKVFKNMGIYVGNLGWASPNNIDNPTISFYVDKSWVNTYDIDISTIKLNRHIDGKWYPLETDLIDEDSDFLYFESKTPGFSQFAVTGNEASAAQSNEEEVVVKPIVIVERKEPVTEQTQDQKDTGIPGFTLLTGFTIMLVVVQLMRRK